MVNVEIPADTMKGICRRKTMMTLDVLMVLSGHSAQLTKQTMSQGRSECVAHTVCACVCVCVCAVERVCVCIRFPACVSARIGLGYQ